MAKVCYTLFQIFLFFWAQNLWTQELQEIKEFGTNPGNLKAFLYSNSTTDSDSYPLVVVLHGCGSNAQEFSAITGWNALAEKYHFKVLYLQQKIGNNLNGCFNWFQYKDIEVGKGECYSIYEAIQYTIQKHKIAVNNIHITGFSAGGAMSLVMATVYPELFQSVAVTAGMPYKIAKNALEAMQAMQINSYPFSISETIKNLTPTNNFPKLILYQGANDRIVSSENATKIIAQWCLLQNMENKIVKTIPNFQSKKNITRLEYQNVKKETKIIYYPLDNVGHQILITNTSNTLEFHKKRAFWLDIGYDSTLQTALDFGLIP